MQKITNLNDFNIIKANLINRKASFQVEKRANTSSVFINKKRTAAFKRGPESTMKYFKKSGNSSIIRSVHAHIRKYILEKYRNNMDIEIVPTCYGSIFTNQRLYNELPNETELAYIDIKHAYWRAAYNLGYINKEMYKKYAENPEFKLGRNIALSTLSSSQERDVYVNGKFLHKISCENDIGSLLYKNIRNYTYNLVGELSELIGDSCIGYRVDGLITLYNREVIMFCKDYFKKAKVLIEVDLLKKIDDKHYVNVKSGDVKKF